MEDNNRNYFIVGIVSYIISFAVMFYYLIIEFSMYEECSPLKRLFVLFIIVALTYIGCSNLRKCGKTFKRLNRINLCIWFILYVVMLLNLTLFDSYFGRSGGLVFAYDPTSIKNYLTYKLNLIPFKTINNYFLAFRNNNISIRNVSYNIIGNIAAFSPFAFFLPRTFKEEKWYTYFIFTTLCIFFVEAMQLVTNSGSFDIDDYILNMFGFVMVYILVNNSLVKKRIDRALYIWKR